MNSRYLCLSVTQNQPAGHKQIFLLLPLLLFVFGAGMFPSLSLSASTLPPGFAETRLATGLDPTSMEIAPDGRLFITEKSGKIRIIKEGTLLSTPFLNITVDNTNERGLQSIAFDPDFSSNGYVYVFYTVPGVNYNRVSRFTASGDAVVANSEVVVLNMDVLSGSVHNGGKLFFKDGKLFITTGEGGSPNRAQSMTSLQGKILRINPDGSIPTDNPFYSTATGDYRAIWALGFRNPFKATVQPGTGRIFINDVGGSSYEEINEGLAGKNYGWPTIEGFKSNQTPPANYQDPVSAYSHWEGCSITGGAFYNPETAQFPSSYVGKYLYADYCNGYIKTLDVTNTNAVASFVTGIDRPVDILVGSDGSLYYLARGGMGGGSQEDNTSSNDGELWKVTYTGSNAPNISINPVSQTILVGSAVTFSVTASGSAPLSYQWQRNQVNISGATSASYTLSSVALSDDGATFRVIVTNSAGSATSTSATLTVTTNQAPTATITTPAEGTKYNAGDVLNFSGTGTDPEDGTLPGSAFTWWIDFHHDSHTHPALAETSGSTSGSYTIPTTGETSDNVWYRIYLRVTDSEGQSKTTYREVYPNKVTVTLASDPAGLPVELDGQSVTTPYSFTGVVGIIRSIEAASSLNSNGLSYQFGSWSDAGEASHTISTPATNTTYTATFTQVPRAPENPAAVVNGLDYKYYEGDWSILPNFAALTPAETGTIANFDLSPRNRGDNFGFSYSGYINIPTDGSYTFYTSSDDGSKLYIGNSLVVNNDGLHGTTEQSGRIVLKAGKHAITVTYFESGWGEVLSVSYAGPNLVKQVIPDAALYRSSEEAVSLTLEAEEASKAGVQNASSHTGYTGTGFGDYINASNDYLEWTATVATAGTYTLTFRYALSPGSTNPDGRPLEIKVNGTVLEASMAFPSTTGWTDWSTVSTTATLDAGTNQIRATAIGFSGPNLDHLRVTSGSSARLANQAGTGEHSSVTVRCYPVPASERLVIESETELEPAVRLTNVRGTVFSLACLEQQPTRLVVNTADLKKGLYLLRVHTKQGIVTRKILIHR